jgi:hypothetical protein
MSRQGDVAAVAFGVPTQLGVPRPQAAQVGYRDGGGLALGEADLPTLFGGSAQRPRGWRLGRVRSLGLSGQHGCAAVMRAFDPQRTIRPEAILHCTNPDWSSLIKRVLQARRLSVICKKSTLCELHHSRTRD